MPVSPATLLQTSPEEAALGAVKCSGVWSSQAPWLLRGTSSAGQPASVMCSPGITLLRTLLSPRTGCFCGE